MDHLMIGHISTIWIPYKSVPFYLFAHLNTATLYLFISENLYTLKHCIQGWECVITLNQNHTSVCSPWNMSWPVLFSFPDDSRQKRSSSETWFLNWWPKNWSNRLVGAFTKLLVQLSLNISPLYPVHQISAIWGTDSTRNVRSEFLTFLYGLGKASLY